MSPNKREALKENKLRLQLMHSFTGAVNAGCMIYGNAHVLCSIKKEDL